MKNANMKIHPISDMHVEFCNYQPPMEADEADVIVLAGDIWLKDHGIHWARSTWPNHEIVYVAGNHEFYASERTDVIGRLRVAAEETGVHFLENDEVIINGVRFLGCTLWTDFELFGVERKEFALARVNQVLNDFRLIKEGPRSFTTADSLKLHEESRRWLHDRLRQQYEGDTVVVTHHAPSWHSVAPRYQKDTVSTAFASRLDDLMGKEKLWIHGHTHDSFDYEVNGTRIICNPRGYTSSERSQENVYFDPRLLIEL